MPKRMVALACVFVMLFCSVAGRLAYINFTDTYKVSDTYNSYTLNIGKLYQYIYDCRGQKLNNNSKSYVAIIKPNEQCLAELDKLFTAEEIAEITEELSKGYPIIRTVKTKPSLKHIEIVEKIEENSLDMPCRHLLDFQCGGLETYTNKEIGSLSVNFSVDAMGRMLTGNNDEIIDRDYSSTEGVVISIDKEIQTICEASAQSITKGAVVVMDVKNSRVLASLSKGDDYNNRALSGYAVGSVFKLVVCACAMENKVNSIYSCNSKITVADTTFTCQKNHSHGLQNMKQALANSCNCYFVNLALELSANKLYATAKAFGFGEMFKLYDNWNVRAGEFPTLRSLDSLGQLALLGFGQGKLTDSPMHFASVISCIANGGSYYFPTLDIADVTENRIISNKTAQKLCEYMHYVVSSGTGANADYKNKTAGKTATAQSGIYNNGKEVLNTWFAGFYPVSNPKYAIVVMQEDGVSGAGDCCPVFRTIVEKIENR
ncbi:MAG: penicillin-binding transpeptidase domain-containing protein [Clostridium sp.]|nr:penicillin-binding transpeptidase domain-containing protein [Clostridium sp.]